MACQQKGMWKEAVTHWRETARLQPDSVEIQKLAAWALATNPDPEASTGHVHPTSARHE